MASTATAAGTSADAVSAWTVSAGAHPDRRRHGAHRRGLMMISGLSPSAIGSRVVTASAGRPMRITGAPR
jgi:hypothetical protein